MRVTVVSGENFVVRGRIEFVKQSTNGRIKMFMIFDDKHSVRHRVACEDVIDIQIA